MKRMRLFPLLLLGMLVVAFTEVNEAQAAVAHDVASESHTGTTGSASQASFTWTHTPAGTPRGVLVFVYTISATQTVTSVTYGGVAMTQVTGGAAVDTAGEPGRVDTFFLGASIPTGARPVVVNRTNNAVVMYATAITVTAAADTEVTGIVLLQNNQALVEQSVTDGSPGINSVRYAGTYSGLAAPPAAGANSTLLHSIDFGAFGVSTARETTAGQGARLVGFDTGGAGDDVAAVHLAVRERTTTIATGADPGATTVPPDSGAQTAYDVNQFTLQTSTGTETVTSVTVNLSTNVGVARLAITDAANAELGFTISPVAGSNTISVSGMSAVSGSATTFKVRVTPLSHTAMPAPAGGAYAITAPVTSWAGNYTGRAGSDTNTNPLTIDNQSPAEVTLGTTIEGNGQITLNWTNPGGDFSNVVILRNTVAISDVPAEGSAPAVNTTIGTSVVRYILNGTTFTDTGLINGTAYFYKIFAKDTSGNYSAAPASLGPFTPSTNCYAVATGNWTAPATWSSSSGGAANTCSGAGGVPDGTISAFIGETATAYTVTIPAVTTASAADVTIGNATSVNNSKALTLAANTTVLNVTGNVNIYNPLNNGNTNALNVDAGTVTVGGNVALNGTSANNARVARIQITTGTLTVSGGLTYTAGNAARAVIDMSTGGGTGVLNLAGALTINTTGTLTSSTASTFNFNGTAAQTIPIGVSSVVYNNLHVNNTSAAGATLSAAISATNVTGDVRVQGTSILNNGGFAIVGNAAKTFEVVNGATFNLSGSVMATGFGAKTFGPTSTVRYARVDGNQNVSIETYGHLVLTGGASGGFNKRLLAGTTTIAGNFTLEADTVYDGPQNNPAVNLAGNFTNNGTFNAGTGVFTFDGNVSKTITGVTTFGNLTFNKTGGATVTANSNLAITRNFVNTAGFNAGSTTTTFNGTIDQTITGATTFYNLTLNNSNASRTELTLNNDVTVDNTFTFTLGNVVTGTANTLVIGNMTGCGVTGAAANRHVVGNLRKNFTGTLLSCTFEIGDGQDYLPVDVAFSAVNTAGTLTVFMTTTGSHPQIGSSAINSLADVNLYWTLVKGSTLDFTNYTATFRYSDGTDPDGTTPSGTDYNDNPANADDPGYMIQRYEVTGGSCATTGGTWNNTTLNDPAPTSRLASAKLINSIGTCSQFAVGAPTVANFVYEKEFIYTREIYY